MRWIRNHDQPQRVIGMVCRCMGDGDVPYSVKNAKAQGCRRWVNSMRHRPSGQLQPLIVDEDLSREGIGKNDPPPLQRAEQFMIWINAEWFCWVQ